MTLADLVSRLGRLDLDTVAQAELARQGDHLAEQVRIALSTLPGGPHDHPWLETGALRDSIVMEASGDQAVVASTSAVALYQEHGTATLPPRPTLAPVAAEQGDAIAQAIAQAIAASLTQAIRNA